MGTTRTVKRAEKVDELRIEALDLSQEVVEKELEEVVAVIVLILQAIHLCQPTLRGKRVEERKVLTPVPNTC
jgi:hypothetical protein